MIDKPAPLPTNDTRQFWLGCDEEKLLYQRCDACENVQFYPRRICAFCQSGDLTVSEAHKMGSIHSFTIVHRAGNRAFDADVPFVVALIDLDEGFRMMMNVVGKHRLSAAIGHRVTVIFERLPNGQNLPQAILYAAV